MEKGFKFHSAWPGQRVWQEVKTVCFHSGCQNISTFTEPELTWVILQNNKHIKQDLEE